MRVASRVFLANAVVTIAILLALEFGSRVLRPVELPDPLITRNNPAWARRHISDPILFWRMAPNLVLRGKQLTNSLGLRGAETPAKGPHEFRILSLGESTTFAARLPVDENYSSQLERFLPAVDGRPVRVVNAGVVGYSLFQGVTYLETGGMSLAPDGVLTYFGFNDFLPVSHRAARAGESGGSLPLTDRELYERQRTLRFRIGYALLRYSNLARLVALRDSEAPVQMSDKVRVPDADRTMAVVHRPPQRHASWSRAAMARAMSS